MTTLKQVKLSKQNVDLGRRGVVLGEVFTSWYMVYHSMMDKSEKKRDLERRLVSRHSGLPSPVLL